MHNINEYSIGDIVKIKSTGETTEINSISVESGGYYIYLKNGYRVNDVNELCKVHKLTNYERIKNITIEEMAEDRIYWKEYNDTLNGIQIRWYGDYYSGLKGDIKKEEAIKKEIEWLNSEVD